MPHVDTLHEHRGEPSQGAALSSRTSHWQVHPAGRSSYNFQTPVVQEDKELPRATEPGQKQKKVKVKQGGRQPAGFSSPLFFHTHGNARNSEVLFCFLEWLLYRAAVRPSMLRMYSPSDKVRVAQPYPLPVSLDLAQLGQYIHTSSSLFCYTFFAALNWDFTFGQDSCRSGCSSTLRWSQWLRLQYMDHPGKGDKMGTVTFCTDTQCLTACVSYHFNMPGDPSPVSSHKLNIAIMCSLTATSTDFLPVSVQVLCFLLWFYVSAALSAKGS